MKSTRPFLHFAALCGFLTVFTTLGIHAFFPGSPADFEQRVLLFKDLLYLLNRWWVIVHCVLVLVAMWGFALVQFRKAAGFVGLGFLFFTIFAFTEIARQMLVLFYLNGLRAAYVAAETPVLKENLRFELDHFGLINLSLFGIFILAFGLGNLCYGLSLYAEKGLGKVLSWLLMFWSIGSFLALGNEFWQKPNLNNFIHYYNMIFQPFIRALVAWWLWQKAKDWTS